MSFSDISSLNTFLEYRGSCFLAFKSGDFEVEVNGTTFTVTDFVKYFNYEGALFPTCIFLKGCTIFPT